MTFSVPSPSRRPLLTFTDVIVPISTSDLCIKCEMVETFFVLHSMAGCFRLVIDGGYKGYACTPTSWVEEHMYVHSAGISKPMLCQAYLLQPGGFREKDGNHENEEDKSDNHKKAG